MTTARRVLGTRPGPAATTHPVKEMKMATRARVAPKPRTLKRAAHDHCEALNDRHVGYCPDAATRIYAGATGLRFTCETHGPLAAEHGSRLLLWHWAGPLPNPTAVRATLADSFEPEPDEEDDDSENAPDPECEDAVEVSS